MSDASFAERMKWVPDEELINILSSDGFRPEAVEAAKAEFERRKIDPNEIQRMSAEVEEVRLHDESKADLPLSTTAKLAFLAFGVILFWSVVVAIVLRTRGYDRKSREAFQWILGSWLFWGFCAMIINFIAG